MARGKHIDGGRCAAAGRPHAFGDAIAVFARERARAPCPSPSRSWRSTRPRHPSACGASRTDRRAGRRASTSSPIACASAISATSRGKVVRSAAQSRNVERKPCTVMSVPAACLSRRQDACVRPPDGPGATGEDVVRMPDRLHGLEHRDVRHPTAAPGALCRPSSAAAGTVQTRSARSISGHVALIASPALAAVSTMNSRQRAGTLSCWRSAAMKAPISP